MSTHCLVLPIPDTSIHMWTEGASRPFKFPMGWTEKASEAFEGRSKFPRGNELIEDRINPAAYSAHACGKQWGVKLLQAVDRQPAEMLPDFKAFLNHDILHSQ
jgi:hypothetical protein